MSSLQAMLVPIVEFIEPGQEQAHVHRLVVHQNFTKILTEK